MWVDSMEGVTRTSPGADSDNLTSAVHDTCTQFRRVDSQRTADDMSENALKNALFATIACTEIAERGEGALLTRVEGSVTEHLRALADVILFQTKPQQQESSPLFVVCDHLPQRPYERF